MGLADQTIRLNTALAAWGTPEFRSILKEEIESLDSSQLPLIQAMRYGSVPLEGSVEAMIQTVEEKNDAIIVKAGIFFKSLIAGCACADDPTPENENNEYIELQLEINKSTAESAIILTA